MNHNPVQADLGHAEFFHKQRGKRHVLGAHASVDSIILGRDVDGSGHDPHAERMSKFSDYAGMRSGDKPQRPFRKPLHAMHSCIDTEVFGHDIDASGPSPHTSGMKTFRDTGHGGMQVGTTPHRPFRKTGYAMKSTMDDIIYGRDIDFSGDDPHQKFTQTYTGHAGVVTENRDQRPFRKQNMTHKSQMDEIIYGRDLDQSGPAPHETWMMDNFKDHAGMKSGEKVERPYRKPGITLRAVVDDVIQGHDVDGSGPHVHHDHFHANYTSKGHAGGVSGAAARRSPRPPAKQEVYAGKLSMDQRQLQRTVGGYGGLRDQPRPAWNSSTRARPAAPSCLTDSSQVQATLKPEAFAFSPAGRTVSEAGTSEAGTSVAGEKRPLSKAGSSAAGSRSARQLASVAERRQAAA